MRLLLLALSSALAQPLEDGTAPSRAVQTPCQRCCAPGGDCSQAFKGTPGQCCGVLEGQAFCCPSEAAKGAKCYNCGSTYRCYTGLSSRNICGASRREHHLPHRHLHPRSSEHTQQGVLVICAVALVLALIFCARRQGDVEYVPVQQGGMVTPMGKPMGYGAPGGTPYAVGGYGPVGGGYSGCAVAGSAAAGFVGGMLVSDALSHHAHGHEMMGYPSADYGGGGFDGGGDFGGGDAGFAADS